MKRKYLWLLALAFIFACGNSAMAAFWDEHSGDSWEDAYIIDSTEDLQELHNKAVTFEVTRSKYFKLAADISVEATKPEDWANQVLSATSLYAHGYIDFFHGHFDGQNHTITVNFDSTSIEGVGDAALFGTVNNDETSASVKNLNLKGTVKGKRYAVGIVKILFNDNTIIENCSFTGTIEAIGYVGSNDAGTTTYAGGIVGEVNGNYTLIRNCQFSGELRASGYGSAVAGGIAAEFTSFGEYLSEEYSPVASIDNCSISDNSVIYALGDSDHVSYAGGIAGSGQLGIIQNCHSGATITAKYAGGILGYTAHDEYRNKLINNTYTGSYPEVGTDGAANPNPPSPSPDPAVENTNIISGLELASLDADYDAYIQDPAAYFDSFSGDDFGGHIPNPINFEHLANNPVKASSAFYSAAALQSSYKTPNMPAVRNQLSYRTCWAFATLGALEINYLKNHSGSNIDLSELHMSWFVFEDPRDGYKFSRNQGRETDTVLRQGGYPEQPRAFLTRMSGAVQESALPYSKADSVESETKGKNSDSYACYVRVKEFYDLGDIGRKGVDYSAHRDDIKALIMECGGVAAAYRNDTNFFNTLRSAYYQDTTQKSGHMVVLVGWDDNYAKTNFAAGQQPENNGAWLVRNSYGSSRHEGGYFWMSYEQSLGNITAYKADTAEKNLVYYGHDALGRTNAVNVEYSANMFNVKNAKETLKEVAFYTMDNNAEYEISVYNCGTSTPTMTPIHGSPVATKSGTIARAGYHTIDLSSSNASFNKGDWFTVVLHLKSTANCPKCTAVEEPSRREINAQGEVVINKCESLFSKDGETWADGINTSAVMEGASNVTAQSMNACIKAFTIASSNSGSKEQEQSNSSKNSGGGGCSAMPYGLFALSFIALAALKIKTR